MRAAWLPLTQDLGAMHCHIPASVSGWSVPPTRISNNPLLTLVSAMSLCPLDQLPANTAAYYPAIHVFVDWAAIPHLSIYPAVSPLHLVPLSLMLS